MEQLVWIRKAQMAACPPVCRSYGLVSIKYHCKGVDRVDRVHGDDASRGLSAWTLLLLIPIETSHYMPLL